MVRVAWWLVVLVAGCAGAPHVSPTPAPPAAVAAVEPDPEAEPTSGEALIWVIRTLGKDPHPDIDADKHAVELMVRGGGVDRTFRVGEATGALMPSYQRVCDGKIYPATKHEIAKIAFFYAGSDIFIVRSAKEGYEIVHAEDGHSPCERGDCTLPQVVVKTFRATFTGEPHESIRLVDERGQQRPYSCKP